MQEFFHMGGKAFYVWSAYGVTLLALIISLVIASRRRKKLVKEIVEDLQQ